MPFTPGIRTINVLAANQVITSNITLADITGFTYALPAGKQIKWEMRGIFTLGATGGFRFRANSTAAPTAYNTEWSIVDVTTPTRFDAAQSAAADFANASAVAGNYRIWGSGYILANAATTFSLQIAQNTSDVLSETLLRGATMEIILF